jgi:DNA gyrase/topoisomerase IV subunit A
MVLRVKVQDVKEAGRATRGVHLMDVKEGDKVASIARIAMAELKKVGANTNGEPPPEPGTQFSLPIK